jgi:transcriptional regulator with XRE-family HTH domain
MNIFKNLRLSKGLSQSDLAVLFEVKTDTISRIERGDGLITDNMIWWYATFFCYSIADLYLISRKKLFEEMRNKYV